MSKRNQSWERIAMTGREGGRGGEEGRDGMCRFGGERIRGDGEGLRGDLGGS